jgi:tetratricopeptide (TPR) repeat protein
VQTSPEPQSQCLLAAAQTNLGVLLMNLGRLPDAERAFAQADAALVPREGKPPTSRKEYPALLAKNHVWYGMLYARTQREAPAEIHLRKGIDGFTALLQSSPRNFMHRNELITAYEALATLYDKTGREAPAADAWAKGIAVTDEMARDSPTFPWVRMKGDRMRVHSLVAPARQGRLDRVLAPARALAAKENLPGELCYELGVVYALAAGAAPQSPQAEECAVAAVALLRRAADAGYFRNDGHLNQLRNDDDDLRSLRSRGDYQKLLDELNGNRKATPKT